jgi:hypothetical protein
LETPENGRIVQLSTNRQLQELTDFDATEQPAHWTAKTVTLQLEDVEPSADSIVEPKNGGGKVESRQRSNQSQLNIQENLAAARLAMSKRRNPTTP